MQLEHDSTTNVYTFAKLYHQKRPGCWQSADDLRQIYRILTHMPADLQLLKCTEIRTELDDQTTVTPDLYSKICSNGNISSSLNANGGGGTTIVSLNGSGSGSAAIGTATGMMLLNGSGSSTATGAGQTGDTMMVVGSTGSSGSGGCAHHIGGEDEFSMVVTEPEMATNIDV